MANFAGADLGLIEEISTSAAPNDAQLNAYPGVTGLERLDLGGRGGSTLVRGVLAGVNLSDLASIQQTFRALQVGGEAAPFFDDALTWPDVVLVMFRPVGPRYLLVGGAGVAQRYEAEFLHLD